MAGTGGPVRTAVRVAAVSYVPPFHDHRARGVSLVEVGLEPLRDYLARSVREREVRLGQASSCPGGRKEP